MAEFTDVFPGPKPITPGMDNAEVTKLKAMHEAMGSNITVMMSAIEPGLEELKVKLDARHVHLGEMIGAGGMGGLTYNLTDDKGKVLEHSVIRIDPADMTKPLETSNPSAVQPLLRVESDYLAATIVPRAIRTSLNVEDQETLPPDVQEANKARVRKAIAVLNTDHLLPKLTDLAVKQFMEVPGMPIPVLTDLSCLNKVSDGMGDIKSFSKSMNWDLDKVQGTTVAPDEMAALRAAQDRVHERSVTELKAAGVDIEAVPTRQSGVELKPLEESRQQGTGKH